MNARIGLVHLPPASSPSGGDLYDRKLLQVAAARGFPLYSVPWRDGTMPAGNWHLLVWDSLLLDRFERMVDERVALLLHWLPSLDPALEPSVRTTLQAAEHRAFERADFVIAAGKPLADAVAVRRPGTPVFLCEPGVDHVFRRARSRRAQRGSANGEPVRLLTVAHLLPAKGHRELLAILRQLRNLPWHWHLAGDLRRSSQTTRDLRDLAAQAGLTDRISFHGAVAQEEVASLMADSDLFVFPSSFESYGMVLAEAVSAGLPVLSNRVGAADQLIRHGVTGLLASPGDWVEFGESLRSLLADAALRARLEENLRHVAVRGWDETFADFRAVCETP